MSDADTPGAEPSPRSRAFGVWMVYRSTWGFLATLSWTTAAVYFIRDLDLSPLELVLVGTALEVAYFVCEIPTAVLADLYSRRLSVVVAALVSGVAMVVIGLAPTVGWAAAGMALWGVGWTFRSGAEDAWLADEVGAEQLGRAYQRGAQGARAAGLAGIAVAVLLAQVDLGLPFLAAGATSMLLALFLVLAMPEHGFDRAARPDLRAVAGMVSTVRDGAHVVRSSPVLILVVVIFVFIGAFEESFDRLWEAHLLLDVGLPALGPLGDVAWFGLLGAATLVLSFAVAAPLVTRLERLRRERLARLLLWLHAALSGLALGFALAGSLWLAVAAFLGTAVVRDLAAPPLATWLNEAITDSSVRATVLSLTSIAGSLGEWTGGPALGAVGNRFGVRPALALGAILLLPTLVLFRRAMRHQGALVVQR